MCVWVYGNMGIWGYGDVGSDLLMFLYRGALLAAVLHEGVQPVLVLLAATIQSVHGHCVWLTG